MTIGQARLAAALAADGYLDDGRLRDAFEAVPRHLFLPDRVWLDDSTVGTGYAQVNRGSDPDRWWAAAYSDVSVVTQIDDGAHEPLDDHWITPTSSASRPSVVALMLAVADLHPGQRVLEIGTGSGFNAALLARLVGEAHVTSVEIDPRVSAHARASLAAVGCHVCVVCADGEGGVPARAPYERVLATVSMLRLPYPLVEQTVEGGLIIAPWETAMCPHGMVRLTVHDRQASGRFCTPVTFMTMRGQRHRARLAEMFTDEAWEEARHQDLDGRPAFLDDDDARFAVGLRLPAVHYWEQPGTGHWLCGDDSWALIDDNVVHQWGPRALFGEASAASAWWEGVGRPRVHDFGLTVSPDGHTAWLGARESGPSWPLFG
ncbi:methyltransferase domain-containing protein [Streptomyces sp. NPDC059850]|uniref:methyltransferase domain-containing protein n=1 Tax=Streptomyces sp. NPDC059850 TaxID=3346970 RepID=UPI00364B6FAC